jgi:alpha-tubulin suppressor-like RCC1 family protein
MPTTNFKNSSGTDIGDTLVEKSYLFDRYPELADTFRQAGLWTWGYGGYGNIGDNTTTTRSSPVQTASGGTNWKEVSSAGYTGFGIKTDGTLWSWGYGYYGQLGNGTSSFGGSTSSPVQVPGTTWKQIQAPDTNIFALKTDGTLWAWGYNNVGQLGDGTTTNRSSPVQITGTWKHIGIGGGDSRGLAIKTDGTLWSWGRGSAYGTLGIGSSGVGVNKNSPVQIAGTTWKFVSAGRDAASAIKTDGTLWVWGDNGYGQIGDGTTTPKSSPVQTIAGGTNWKFVSNGDYINVGIKTDGTLWTWGYNGTGCLGDNTTTPKSSPIQTTAGGTNWKSAYCSTVTGYGWVIALRDNS